MKEFDINGTHWKFIKDFPEHELWGSSYFSSDGDGIELYIEKDNGGLELSCFSGIGASKIYIDSMDFGVFQYAPNKIKSLDFEEPFNVQCLKIAEYLCSIFCEKLNKSKESPTEIIKNESNYYCAEGRDFSSCIVWEESCHGCAECSKYNKKS